MLGVAERLLLASRCFEAPRRQSKPKVNQHTDMAIIFGDNFGSS